MLDLELTPCTGKRLQSNHNAHNNNIYCKQLLLVSCGWTHAHNGCLCCGCVSYFCYRRHSPSRRSPSWFSFIWAGRRISIHSREEYQPSCNKKTAIVWPEQHHVRRQEQGAWSCENDLTISSVDVVTNHYCHICSSALGYINSFFCQKAHFCICKCLTAWLTAFPGDP